MSQATEPNQSLFLTLIEINTPDHAIRSLQYLHDQLEYWKANRPTHQELNTSVGIITALEQFLEQYYHDENLPFKDRSVKCTNHRNDGSTGW